MPTLHTHSFAAPDSGVASFNPKTHGQLAMDFCCQKLPLQVLATANGFYLGTCDQDGPATRESAEYWPTAAMAQEALGSGNWSQRPQP